MLEALHKTFAGEGKEAREQAEVTLAKVPYFPSSRFFLLPLMLQLLSYIKENILVCCPEWAAESCSDSPSSLFSPSPARDRPGLHSRPLSTLKLLRTVHLDPPSSGYPSGSAVSERMEPNCIFSRNFFLSLHFCFFLPSLILSIFLALLETHPFSLK